MDALALLTEQHQEAKQLFAKIEQTEDPGQARALFMELKAALELHEELEETHLYPQMKADPAFKEDTLEAYQEHHVMDLLLREISALKEGAEEFKPKVKVLQENVEHHAIEEEEEKLFPQIRQKWNSARLAEIGQQMAAMMATRKPQKKAA